MPASLAAIVSVHGRRHTGNGYSRKGQDRFARLYHYKTRDYAMGTRRRLSLEPVGLSGDGPADAGSATNPDAQIWINHPGEVLQSGYGRPSYWGGSGTLPRVHQYRGLAVVVFDCAVEQPDFTHAWFPREHVRQFARGRALLALAEADDAFVVIRASAPLAEVASGPTAGNEICASPAERRPGSCA